MRNETSRVDTRIRLIEEAANTLQAIRDGGVDAFVVQDSEGQRVYTLEGSDLPYSTLVERMHQGAAMLDAKCQIMYSNNSFAQLLGVPAESLIGFPLTNFLSPDDKANCQKLLREVSSGSAECEMHIQRADSTVICAHFSFELLSRDKSTIGVLVTDLTARNEQVELASRIQRIQDEERKRIARDLHDSVGQLLAAIGMNLAIIESQSGKLDSAGVRSVTESSELVEDASREIRTISYLLHPPLLDVAGLASALRWYVDGFSARSKIKVNLEMPSDFGRLPDEVEIAVYRIVQECLTNIHRHSGSDQAAISLRKDGNDLIIMVSDRGKGISPEMQRDLLLGRGGIGFGGMRERVRQLEGTLDIKSEGTGTTVTASLKLA